MPDAPPSAHDAPRAAPDPGPADAPLSAFEWALAAAAGGYCVLAPRRLWADVAVFLAVAALVAASRRGWRPAARAGAPRLEAGLALATLLAAAGLLGWGLLREAPGVTPARLALTCALYLPFALVQQHVTQRFVLGRFGRRLAPRPALAPVLAGVLFGLCHLSLAGLTAPTVVTGVAWCWVYERTGRLAPLAASHALLGACWFLAVLDRDPFRDLGLAG